MEAIRRRLTQRAGQSMVEFALLAPSFFLLLMGILDFGRVGFYYVSAIDLAKQTARYAAAYDNGSGFSSSEVSTYITTQAKATAMGTPTYVDWNVCARPNGPPSLACQKPGTGQSYYWVKKCIAPTCIPETVTVTVVYAFTPTTPLVSNVTGTIYLWADSVMIKEYNG
jgi:Flp pilus assembly protein TadG